MSVARPRAPRTLPAPARRRPSRPPAYSRLDVSDFPKTTVEQTVEIESLVSEALETLDQIRYSLKTLEDRLKAAAAQSRPPAPPADGVG
jgi:hypothetical protein